MVPDIVWYNFITEGRNDLIYWNQCTAELPSPEPRETVDSGTSNL